MPAGTWGLEMIALCFAGDIVIFIACGGTDLFCVMQRGGLLLHTPTFSERLGADGLETFSLSFHSASLFIFYFPFFQGHRLAMLSAKSKGTVC